MAGAYIDRHLIHNSSLACFLLASFVSDYEDQNSEFPIDLTKLMLVLPVVWNENNRKALGTRTTRSKIDTVLRDHPVLKIDLEARVKAHAPATLQGLNLAVSSGLVGRSVSAEGEVHFSKLLSRWPPGIKKTIPTDLMKTTKQLAAWYSTTPTETLYKLLFGIPNEIRY
ncbi:TPA: hypothetical protein L4E92_004753 [Pseudomonas aeruginosa]|nr:hypothetical protein [Pseudomonas aeruginosa]